MIPELIETILNHQLRDADAGLYCVEYRVIWKSCQWSSFGGTEQELWNMYHHQGIAGAIEIVTHDRPTAPADEGWRNFQNDPPTEPQKVDWIAPDGDVIRGGEYAGGIIWLLPDSDTYIYYDPVFWRPAKE